MGNRAKVKFYIWSRAQDKGPDWPNYSVIEALLLLVSFTHLRIFHTSISWLSSTGF